MPDHLPPQYVPLPDLSLSSPCYSCISTRDVLPHGAETPVPPFLPLVAKIRRTESVPSDINNPVDRPAEVPQFGTLPKALTKKVTPLLGTLAALV